MIAPIHAAAVPPPPAPPGWEDAEVVDSVLVDPAPGVALVRAGRRTPRHGFAYDRSGRVAPADRFGRHVSVLA